MTLKLSLIAIGYLILFFGGFAIVLYFRKRFRKQRPPLEFVYNRSPGESLSKRIADLNDRTDFVFILCLIVPLAVALITFAFFYFLYPTAPIAIWVPSIIIALLAGLGFSFLGLLKEFQDIANCELGLNGERVVADTLRPLEREGWRVYHDIPASNNGKAFNLDHVVVGPNGVALIETKTRRKGKTREGYKEHEVKYDGSKLIWPWGDSKSELQQTKRQREWLESWIHERTGKTLSTVPILVIPGWWVECTKPGTRTKVVSHKSLCKVIKASNSHPLDPETVDLLSRQLESVCRVKV